MAKVDMWVVNIPGWSVPYAEWKRERVQGTKVEIKGDTYGVFQATSGQWRVLELRTGMWLTVAKTRKEALAQAGAAIEKHVVQYGGLAQFLEAVHPGKNVEDLEEA